jgi:large subunit ribosomal protein L30
MKKYKVSQVRSAIGRPEKQKRTLAALGLRKLHKPVILDGSPQVMGMIEKVKHLLNVEEVQG